MIHNNNKDSRRDEKYTKKKKKVISLVFVFPFRVLVKNRKRRKNSIPAADVDATNRDALVTFAHVLVDVRGPSRAEVAGRALEARLLLTLVTQMPRQGATVGEGAAAGVDAKEFLAPRLTGGRQRAIVFRQPDVIGIDACNRKLPSLAARRRRSFTIVQSGLLRAKTTAIEGSSDDDPLKKKKKRK